MICEARYFESVSVDLAKMIYPFKTNNSIARNISATIAGMTKLRFSEA